jgi:hypothetical protein
MTPNDIFAAVRKLQEDDMALGDVTFHGSTVHLALYAMVLKLGEEDPTKAMILARDMLKDGRIKVDESGRFYIP